jgi:hypothetical protein
MKGRVLPYPLPGSRPLLVSGYGDDPNDVRLAMEWAHIQWAQDRNGHRYRGFCGWVFDAPASEATEGGRTGRVGCMNGSQVVATFSYEQHRNYTTTASFLSAGAARIRAGGRLWPRRVFGRQRRGGEA